LQFRHEATVRAGDLTDGRLPDQRELGRAAPVDEIGLHGRAVIEAGSDVLVAYAIRGQRSLHVDRIDGKPERLARLAGAQAGLRLENAAVENQASIMIGEAKDGSVPSDQFPAVANAGYVLRKMIEQSLRV
jgi:hypothetical protein